MDETVLLIERTGASPPHLDAQSTTDYASLT